MIVSANRRGSPNWPSKGGARPGPAAPNYLGQPASGERPRAGPRLDWSCADSFCFSTDPIMRSRAVHRVAIAGYVGHGSGYRPRYRPSEQAMMRSPGSMAHPDPYVGCGG